jgi:chaperone BCS1
MKSVDVPSVEDISSMDHLVSAKQVCHKIMIHMLGTILAIAGALDLNICVLNLANKNLGDEKLTNLLLNAPPSSIILLEDVDHAIYHGMRHQRHEDGMPEENGEDSVSLSGLLNSIDGVIAQEGKIIFMTTNHLERLPEALIRPGRIDVTKHIDYASPDQLEKLFLKFYPGSQVYAQRFVEAVLKYQKEHNLPNTVTPAALQTFFLRFKESPMMAVDNVCELLAENKK